jgi:hypothetical protein
VNPPREAIRQKSIHFLPKEKGGFSGHDSD